MFDDLEFKRFCDNCGKNVKTVKAITGVLFCPNCGGDITPLEDFNETPTLLEQEKRGK